MLNELDEITQLLNLTGLKEHHFADLIRFSQIVADLSDSVMGRSVQVEWEAFGITSAVYSDLLQLGQEYLYSAPHVSPIVIWQKLSPISRGWLIENKKILVELEEAFPARDED